VEASTIVRLWNLTNGQILKKLTGLQSTQVWSLKRLTETKLAAGCSDQKIYIWDITTGVNTKVLDSHLDTVVALDLINGDATLLSGLIHLKCGKFQVELC
jgi:WD40 repeat protein